jgi:hypothetical protein
MFNTPYYHGTIKKLIGSFGALFSHVQIPRYDNSGVLAQTVQVPIEYGPKEKHFVRQEQDPELDKSVFVTLPRLGFEISGYSYDPTRMVNRMNRIQCFDAQGKLTQTFAPVPYNLDINLYALTKGTEDGLTIVEQILPIFSPEYNVNLKILPELNVTQNVPIILNGVSVQDDYEGDFGTRRFVTHTFNFTAKLNLYGPVTSGGIITQTGIDVDTNNPSTTPLTKRVDIGDPSTGNITGNWIP